jgi:protein tyrosine/serine phosphatase
MSPRSPITAAIALCAFLTGCQSLHPTVHTIPNFDTVNAPHKIYRGGEPLGTEGWAYLKSLGVRTVIKLNTESESTDAGARALHLAVVRLPITGHQQLTGSPNFGPTVAAAVRRMSKGAVFVHCGSDSRSTPNSLPRLIDSQGGQDRTSLVVGCYRVWVEHRKKAEARVEMKSFRFHALLLPGLAHFWRDRVK